MAVGIRVPQTCPAGSAPTRHCPERKPCPVLYMFLKTFVVGPVVELAFRPRAEGLENIPAHGPAILASNHLSVSDSVFLPVAAERPIYFLAKSEYFSGPGPWGRLVAAFFRGIRQIPMDRSGGPGSARSLDRALAVLEEGNLLGIYPEGTRSPDGRLYRAKLGVARLALRSGVPVLPVAMVGTDQVQPIGSRLPRPWRRRRGERAQVRTLVGAPVDLSDCLPAVPGELPGRAEQRRAADRIIQAIQQLSQQEYVDLYAGSVKQLMEQTGAEDVRGLTARMLAGESSGD